MGKWIYDKEKDSYFCEKCGSNAPADLMDRKDVEKWALGQNGVSLGGI